jgi:hypothetical protein
MSHNHRIVHLAPPSASEHLFCSERSFVPICINWHPHHQPRVTTNLLSLQICLSGRFIGMKLCNVGCFALFLSFFLFFYLLPSWKPKVFEVLSRYSVGWQWQVVLFHCSTLLRGDAPDGSELCCCGCSLMSLHVDLCVISLG